MDQASSTARQDKAEHRTAKRIALGRHALAACLPLCGRSDAANVGQFSPKAAAEASSDV